MPGNPYHVGEIGGRKDRASRDRSGWAGPALQTGEKRRTGPGTDRKTSSLLNSCSSLNQTRPWRPVRSYNKVALQTCKR